jgi:Uma2 family endonuclease
MRSVYTLRMPSDAVATRAVPGLDSGARLTRFEFERRYEASPPWIKAELIEGVVYVASPVSLPHGDEHFRLIAWLGAYTARHPEVAGSDNATIRLDLDNEPQPDAHLRYQTSAQNRKVGEYLEGPPELIAEVAVTSQSIDLHDKLAAYRRNGVQEYIVWRVYDRAVDWFALDHGEYVQLDPDAAGVIHSRVFPGLRLAVQALIDGDMATVLDVQGTPAP